MHNPHDILDERDRLTKPFVGSVMIHAGVVALLVGNWFWLNRARENLGEINPGGGPSYSVSPVHNIPIPPREAPPFPVAHDTQSTVPTPPAKQEVEKLPPPDKTAIEIPDKLKPKAEKPQQKQQYHQPTPPNQVYSRTPQAVASPIYGQSGSGRVGIGPNSPLGTRLGWYAELVRERIAQNWHTNGLDARSQMAPAIIDFTIARNGGVSNVRVFQASGNPDIDNTAMRAVFDANPMPPLPAQITDSYITAQFTFNLR